jgi:hypothetical protein
MNISKTSFIGIMTILFVSLLYVGCTSNTRTKMWGGTMRIELTPNRKLVDVTWKETSLWYMTKPMTENDVPETYEFIEDSSWGIVEGKVVFVEKKQ